MPCESLDGLSGNWDPLKGTRRLPHVELSGLGRDIASPWMVSQKTGIHSRARGGCHVSTLSGRGMTLATSNVAKHIELEGEDQYFYVIVSFP